MKTIALILWFVSLEVAFGQFVRNPFTRGMKKCFNELHTTENDVLSYFNSDFTVTENVPALNEFSFCSHRKAHLLHADNTQNEQNYKNYLVHTYLKAADLHVDNPNETVQCAITHCRYVQGYDVGDRIVKNYNCIMHFIVHHSPCNDDF